MMPAAEQCARALASVLTDKEKIYLTPWYEALSPVVLAAGDDLTSITIEQLRKECPTVPPGFRLRVANAITRQQQVARAEAAAVAYAAKSSADKAAAAAFREKWTSVVGWLPKVFSPRDVGPSQDQDNRKLD